METRWISVKERLPKIGQRVLVFVPRDELYRVNIDKVYSEERSDPWECFLSDAVTHWMPLPAPPEQ